MQDNLSDLVKKRNESLINAFENMKECIHRIQYWLEDEWLRIFVLSDYSKNERVQYTLEQVGTSFCVISIGTDNNDEFSIVLSIDSNINEKIGHYFSSILLRRLFEFTPESCAHNVRISNFSKDCDEYLKIVLDEREQGIGFHSISVATFEG